MIMKSLSLSLGTTLSSTVLAGLSSSPSPTPPTRARRQKRAKAANTNQHDFSGETPSVLMGLPAFSTGSSGIEYFLFCGIRTGSGLKWKRGVGNIAAFLGGQKCILVLCVYQQTKSLITIVINQIIGDRIWNPYRA